MDFESRVGQFSNGASFSDDGFIWAITYRQHEIDVTAVRPHLSLAHCYYCLLDWLR